VYDSANTDKGLAHHWLHACAWHVCDHLTLHRLLKNLAENLISHDSINQTLCFPQQDGQVSFGPRCQMARTTEYLRVGNFNQIPARMKFVPIATETGVRSQSTWRLIRGVCNTDLAVLGFNDSIHDAADVGMRNLRMYGGWAGTKMGIGTRDQVVWRRGGICTVGTGGLSWMSRWLAPNSRLDWLVDQCGLLFGKTPRLSPLHLRP